MTPKKLTLRGFAGISAGLNRDELVLDLSALDDAQLVALIGPNGTGKSTVLDNLHPYRFMPSRSSSYSPGAFSWYDHVAPDAMKELIWQFGSETYRSTLVFRITPKTRKMEAFLARQTASGGWAPVVLSDGTISDGKTATYDACVESILGSPQLYFTAAFSAQGRPALSSYTQGDIKALLSELLGLEESAQRSKEAAEVARALRQRKDPLLQSIRRADELEAEAERLEGLLEAAKERSAELSETLRQATARTTVAAKALADIEAEARGGTEIEERRAWLDRESSTVAAHLSDAAKARMKARDRAESIDKELLRAGAALQSAHAEIRERERRLEAAESASAQLDSVAEAEALHPKLREKLREAERSLADAIEQERRLHAVRSDASSTSARLETVKREGVTESRHCEALVARAALIEEVPCRGTDLQGRCKLLSEAVEAKGAIPEARKRVEDRRQEYREILESLELLRADLALLEPVTLVALSAKEAVEACRVELESNTRACAGRQAVEQALAAAEQARSDISTLWAQAAMHKEAIDRHQRDRDSALSEGEQAAQEIETRCASRQAELAAMRSALPPPASTESLDRARADMERCTREQHEAEQAAIAAREQAMRQDAQLHATEREVALLWPARQQANALDAEIAQWTLLSQGLGPNGVIALSIDDAGPSLSSIANDLLESCYGHRFSLRIDTQTETAKKEVREAFDVVVFDADRGSETSVRQMSGGERIWINEALTRAIALYQAQQSGRHYECLFADESDGALDPERKNQFVAMKRRVLEIGGYQREIFISHTPDLWDMADARIDMADYRA
jgi:exonuclease SbcC